MKVTLTCEKCGATVYVCEHLGTGAELDQVLDIMDTNDVGLPSCPNCTKLTYGPLTEEMVADALRQAAYGEPQPQWPPTHLATEFGSQARFVLRLLNDLYPKGGLGLSSPSGGDGNEWLNWLLDLARQK